MDTTNASSVLSGAGVSFTFQAGPVGHLMDAAKQWASRPEDERFASLEDLRAYLETRRAQSREPKGHVNALGIHGTEDGRLTIGAAGVELAPTNWAFGQLSRLAGAPASYLAQLPAPLAAQCLREGLKNREPVKLLTRHDQSGVELRAVTSQSYGRIWDLELLEAVERLRDRDQRWHVPPGWNNRPSGLYASDRDCFMFLVDGGSVIEEPGGFGHRPATLHRGFIVQNSETGSAAFSLTTFLFRVVCGNHIIWDAADVSRLKIIHRSGAPDHFARQAHHKLVSYANASTDATLSGIRQAMQRLLPTPSGRGPGADDQLRDWLSKSPAKLTKVEACKTIEMARAEEGDCRTVWQAVQGATAYARTLPHVDARADLERRAGKLMGVAA